MNWYTDWFNSPYYHILYKNRDDKEAQFFIDNLIKHLKIKKNSKIQLIYLEKINQYLNTNMRIDYFCLVIKNLIYSLFFFNSYFFIIPIHKY